MPRSEDLLDALHSARTFRAAASLASAECYAALHAATLSGDPGAVAAARARVAAADDHMVAAGSAVGDALFALHEEEARQERDRRSKLAEAILAQLAAGPAKHRDLARALKADPKRVADAIAFLRSHGAVVLEAGTLVRTDVPAGLALASP